MDLPSIRPAVKSLVAALTGLVALWENEPRTATPPTAPQALALLTLRPTGSLGWDESRASYDANQPQGEEFEDTLCGVRRATLTVKVESLSETDTETPAVFLERLRDRLARRSSREALNAVGCAYVGDAGVIDLTTPKHGRYYPTAALDILLAVRVSEADPARYGYIDSVDISGPVDPA